MAKKDYKFSNETTNLNAQCKVIIYPWKELLNDADLADEKLAQAGRIDISSQIQNVTFSKNMGSAAGSFSFTLTNSPNYGSNDWKDIIKRGFWCVIYMANDGFLQIPTSVVETRPRAAEAKYIRCVGYIERVAVKGSAQENRSIDVGFTVSGRDFGIIYEQTNIWHNLFQYDKTELNSIAQTKLNVLGTTRIHEALKVIHDLFYYPANIPGAKVNDKKSVLSISLQWLLPREMLIDIGFNLAGLTKGTYWGALPGVFDTIDKGGRISPSDAGIAVDKPGDYLNGNAWQQLKRLSIPPFHELFTEINDQGKPQLIFRPIPWGIDQSKYEEAKDKIQLYKDIKEIVLVGASDLYDFDLGEDDHGRYNSFLATVSTSLISIENNIGLLLGKEFPKNNDASIKRHGFRPMHVTVDSIVKNEEQANGSSDQKKLLQFNYILYDYWNPAVFAESGTILKNGTNTTRLGKVMKFKEDVPYLSTKRYYIEGYMDTFEVHANMSTSWTQSVNLTRGFEEADLVAKKGYNSRNTPFSASGEYTKKNEGES